MQSHIEPPKQLDTASREDLDNDDPRVEEDTSGALSAFGHLTLGEEGESYYHGQAAQTEV